ncbi:MAG: hypothetical protein DI536_22290 [Archangium gephyra]|uniref:Uncharacterized protein n=1 Tax=Archangium gephyra TaxID=48 RepID=A0A2W5V0W5_9BACT|nr:MAG: hypothetical protein DI536_22290 [Archangium gephyra]
MSNHEFEDVIEQSIRVLHAHDGELDHRSAFVSLWRFQERGDCGFTHFRVLDILLERRATYRFPHDVHPAIDTLDDDAVNRDQGFKDDHFVYCDAGTSLWEQLKEELNGDDTKAPVDIPLGTLALHVARAAERAGELELIAAWFDYGPDLLFGDAAQTSPEALELKAIARRTNAPTREVEAWESPLRRWWFS